MSKLIDNFLKEEQDNTLTQIDLKWYIAKPISFFSINTFLKRIKDAIRVIKGKSFAVHYKELITLESKK
jgi:hypothetical protein